MHQLRVEVDGTTVCTTDGQTLRIGRALDADVRLSGDTVSRAHAELRPVGDGWIIADAGSQHGTYVSGQRISQFRITQPVTVYCGLQDRGSAIRIILERVEAEAVAPVTNRVGSGPAEPDQLRRPQARPERPGGAPDNDQAGVGHPSPAAGSLGGPVAPSGFAETVSVGGSADPSGPVASGSGPELLIRVEAKDHHFRHPAAVTIGRHPDSTVVVSDSIASRYHGRIEAVPGGWVYRNVSKEGTYVDGRKHDVIKLKDDVTLHLGHPVAGPEVVITPLREARAAEKRITGRRRRRVLVVGAAVVATIAVIIGIALVAANRDGDPPAAGPTGPDQLTGVELDNAKLATVLIIAGGITDSGEEVTWSGSGSIISTDGMILTNAHVAEPQADGLAEIYGPSELPNPKYVLIALIRSADDSPADPAYRARVVESDGSLDASVLQIFATIDGERLPQELELPTVPLGDSDEVRTGDEVTVLGFPTIAQSDGVSVTRGVVSTFISDPEREIERAEIDTDARIAPGNSGGLAINNAGEIIGIPSALFAVEGTPVASGRIRPIDLVKPLIEQSR